MSPHDLSIYSHLLEPAILIRTPVFRPFSKWGANFGGLGNISAPPDLLAGIVTAQAAGLAPLDRLAVD
jgi:hypothetical protein